eukprot:scaffold24801_cov107-Phaeocystis_antarctica.AAC.8
MPPPAAIGPEKWPLQARFSTAAAGEATSCSVLAIDRLPRPCLKGVFSPNPPPYPPLQPLLLHTLRADAADIGGLTHIFPFSGVESVPSPLSPQISPNPTSGHKRPSHTATPAQFLPQRGTSRFLAEPHDREARGRDVDGLPCGRLPCGDDGGGGAIAHWGGKSGWWWEPRTHGAGEASREARPASAAVTVGREG